MRNEATMSTKELHVLKFWQAALIRVFKKQGKATAGQVGREVGQSRKTAKKYLDRLIAEEVVEGVQAPWQNGVMTTFYSPVRGGR